MGKIVNMVCPQCGHEFEVFLGKGLMGVTPEGGIEDEDAPVPCPECGQMIERGARSEDEGGEVVWFWD